jgi:hypothetical protein
MITQDMTDEEFKEACTLLWDINDLDDDKMISEDEFDTLYL